MEAQTLLLVEDNLDNQDVMLRLLRHHQVKVEAVSSGEEALNRVQEKPATYKGVIIDLSLPEIDGWSLLNRFLSTPETRHLRCVAITAYHSPELNERALKVGFQGYFAKPLQHQAFLAELHRLGLI